jgi:hypothetical protein
VPSNLGGESSTIMTDVDMHIDEENTSSASNVYHNALLRSGIVECIHHQHEQADMTQFALTSKEAYRSALRYLRRKVTFSQVIEASRYDRYAQYLESVHALVVQEHSVRLVDGQLLVEGEKQSGDPDIALSLSLVRSYHYGTPHVFHLEGIRHMPNLEWISIECCPSNFLDPKLNLEPSIRVHVERREIYKVGLRRITVKSRARGKIRRWDWETLWDPQAMRLLKDDPTSASQRLRSRQAVLDTITIWPSERAAIEEEEDTDDIDLWVDPVIQSLRHWKMNTRLRGLRNLYIKDQDICAETLQMILYQCPELEQVEVSLSSDPYDDGLLEALSWNSSLIDVTLSGNAKIEWLPFLRRCKRVSLLSLREVDGERFSPPSVLVCWNVSEWEDLDYTHRHNLDLDKVYLEDLTLDLPISGVRTCLQADTLVRFIKTNTKDQTRVHLNVTGAKVDFDVRGITDEDDDDGSGRDVEMMRAHRAILRYAADEREKLDRVAGYI